MTKAKRGAPLAERLNHYTDRVADGSGCWLWTGHIVNGYGRIKACGRNEYAHRAAYELVHGPIPPGMWVLHSCDTRACLNPAHLFLGTHDENMADMRHKGRARPGTRKLSVRDVRDIRAAHRSGESQASLAQKFGVQEATIRHAINGTTWKIVARDEARRDQLSRISRLFTGCTTTAGGG